MLGNHTARTATQAGRLYAADVMTASTDFSSCWLALPNGIRQRLEPMLASSAGESTGRSTRVKRAAAAR